jgi:hypothetical protein
MRRMASARLPIFPEVMPALSTGLRRTSRCSIMCLVRDTRTVTCTMSHRMEGLVGRSMEISNYAYVQQATALAVLGGGGVSMPITKLIGWNVEADYVYSKLPNAVNDNQSTLRVSTGIFFRFGPR